jgi:hypoxanthine phosphoribosyltransferase
MNGVTNAVVLKRISWNEFGKIVSDLSKKIESEDCFDVIVGVGGSGSIPASILVKLLRVEYFFTIKIQFYDEDKPPKKIYDRPRISSQNLPNLERKRVLIVDDFTRSGSTMNAALKAIRSKDAEEVKSAVIAVRKDARIKPDYFGMVFDDCVIFPWDLEQH